MAGKLITLLLFLFAINWFYDYVGMYAYINVRPCSIHSSAQCQRASIALNYYETSMDFFKPRVQKYSEMGGVTGVEFPIMYYADALIYKCFGFHENYARLFSLLVVSFGLLMFYLLAARWLNNRIFAMFVVLSGAASPAFLFYTPNFMPDAPSVALVLASWYYFFRYYRNPKEKYLLAFFVFACLAALIKVVALISVIALLCILILDRIGFYKTAEQNRIFKKPWRVLTQAVICILLVLLWYTYANWLAKAYHNETFSLKPEMGDEGTWNALVQNVKQLWLYHYYAYESYVLMGISVLVLLVFARYVSRLLFSITLLFFLGNLAFVFFFLNQFINHDYYIISILPLVFFLFLTMADALLRFSNVYFLALRPILFLLILFNFKEAALNCRRNYENRYSNEIYYWAGDFRPYFDLEPRLRAAGIKRTDLTISGFDDTFCSSLYLMNQIGIPISTAHDSLKIKELIQWEKSKYLILNDTGRFRSVYPYHFASEIVLTHRGLTVYRLKH
ncbi:MAG TPA: glycosyltransferase family 39 protein [Bacteroidia bacterium]|nr:glycosyltransferase family 39 protein [Bacteroidia bacterium]